MASPLDSVTPLEESEVADIVRSANAGGTTLRIVGHGSKSALGRNAPQERLLTTRRLNGVSLYEPQELVLTARAGTPLRDIIDLLDENGQQFAFEPIDYATLLGDSPRDDTLGGAISVNASGPRRIRAGAARDHVLGIRCVTGRGDIVKSGGRVMKNVTGYDLSKLLTGAFGTLAILTEITMKVLPKPETERTVLATGLGERESLALLRGASATPYEVSGLAVSFVEGHPTAALRLDGPEISVAHRSEDLIQSLRSTGAHFEKLDESRSRAHWIRLRDAAPVAEIEGQVWRLSVAPSDGFSVVDSLRGAGAPILAHFYDWAGGLIWLCLDGALDAHAVSIRAAVNRVGGHATLIRASEDVRGVVEVFHPQPETLARLTRSVKESFDPAHILERGRMRTEF